MEAKKELERSGTHLRREELVSMAFFTGIIFIVGILFFLLIMLPGKIFNMTLGPNNPLNKEDIYPFLPVYRCTLVFILTLYAVGIVIRLFRIYGINYIFIFEFDPAKRIRQNQLYNVTCYFDS